MSVSRRTITTALAIALAGCTPAQQAQWTKDAAAIGPALVGFGDAIAGAAGVPVAVVNNANAYVTQIEAAASTIAAAVSVPATSAIQALEAGALDLLPIAEQYLNGTKWATTVEAIVSLLPEFLALAGVVAAARVTPMTVDQARAVLHVK